MATYKLYYFNARGCAGIARFLFHLAGIKYENVRYEQKEWPKHKEIEQLTVADIAFLIILGVIKVRVAPDAITKFPKLEFIERIRHSQKSKNGWKSDQKPIGKCMS